MGSCNYRRDFGSGLAGKYGKVVSCLPPNSSILEVGCHAGDFSIELIKMGHEVIAIEKDPMAAGEARRKGITVIQGDIEEKSTIENLSKEFEVILFMDILEHLRDPNIVLRRARSLLNRNGRMIVTGPNIAYWGVRKNLFLGRWNYADAGILDKTHLHFYTKQGWRSLLEEEGYEITLLEPAEGMVPFETVLKKHCRLSMGGIEKLRVYACRIAPSLFTVVYLILASAKQNGS